MCPPVKQNKLQLICEKFYDVPFLQLNQSLFILKHISNYSYQWESIFWEWRIRLEDGWDCLNNMEGTQLSVNRYWWTFSREMGLKQGHTGTRCVCLMSCSQRRTTAKSDTVLCAQRPPHGARVKLGRIWLRAAPWKQSCPCPVTCQSRAVLPQLTTLKPAPAGSPGSPKQGSCGCWQNKQSCSEHCPWTGLDNLLTAGSRCPGAKLALNQGEGEVVHTVLFGSWVIFFLLSLEFPEKKLEGYCKSGRGGEGRLCV